MPIDKDEILEREMLENAGEWRSPPQPDQQWRAPPPEELGRVTLGFDSVYEEAQQRREDPVRVLGDRQAKPTSVLKFNF